MSGGNLQGQVDPTTGLSEIFTSLAQSRQNGTLTIRSQNRVKRLYFDQGSVVLLSPPKRIRLGDFLVSTGKLTEDDLDLAVKLQKQNNLRLGEILIEEGFCDETDIRRGVRYQVECELYDVFLWSTASYEFSAGDKPPESDGNNSVTELAIESHALITEAALRLRDWNQNIRPLVPSVREIYVLTNRSAEGLGLPEKLNSALSLFDGKHSVESIAQRVQLSDFETCKHLSKLVKNGVLSAISSDELRSRAREAYALNEFDTAAQLFARLEEHFPNDISLRLPLADSLRQSGDTEGALAAYERLTRELEQRNGEDESLKRCYQSIYQLDPRRQDALTRLQALEASTKRKRGSGKRLLPWIFLVLLASGVGGFWFWLLRSVQFQNRQNILREEAGKAKLEEFKKLQDSDDLLARFNLGKELFQQYRDIPGVAKSAGSAGGAESEGIKVPLRVRTNPPGFEVMLNGEVVGATSYEKPELIALYSFDSTLLEVSLRAAGRVLENTRRQLKAYEFHDLRFDVDVGVDWRATLNATQDAAAATFFDESRDGSRRLAIPARDGAVYILTEPKEGSGELNQSPGVTVGRLGDRLSGISSKGDLAFVGLTEGGVTAIDVRAGAVAEPKFPSDAPVTGAPIITEDRVVFGDYDGKIYTYNRKGKLLSSLQTPSVMPYSGVLAPSGTHAFFAGKDGVLRRITLADGREDARLDLGVDPAAAPQICGNRVVTLGDDGAALVTSSLDLNIGLSRFASEGQGPRDLAILDKVLCIASRGGAQAWDLDSGAPLWSWQVPLEADDPAAADSLPRVQGLADRFVISTGRKKLYALDASKGRPLWICRLSAPVRGPMVSFGGSLVAGLDGLDVVKFTPRYR